MPRCSPLLGVHRRFSQLLPPICHRAGSLAAAEISKYETGRRTPSLESLERLARGLKIPIADFFAEEEKGLEPGLDELLLRLRGKPEALIRRVIALTDALIETE